MSDRRVERRNFQVGTGMMNDPERLEELAHQRQQSELNARLPPKTSFREVLAAPAAAGPPRKRKRPLSKEKLRPTAAHPAQQMVGFGVDDDDAPKGKIVVKV
jgi:hypothetical protein